MSNALNRLVAKASKYDEDILKELQEQTYSNNHGAHINKKLSKLALDIRQHVHDSFSQRAVVGTRVNFSFPDL